MTNKQKRKILDSYANDAAPAELDNSNKVVIRYRRVGKTYDKRTIIPIKAEGDDLYMAVQVSGDSETGLNKSRTSKTKNEDNTRTFNLNDLQIVKPTKVKQQ
jgi:hypothetical protein